MRQIPIVLAMCLPPCLSVLQMPRATAQDDAKLTGVAAGAAWTQWGGTNARMNTPVGTNIPTDWNVGQELPVKDQDRKKGQHPAGSQNIKWAVKLGSETYGNPVVAGGKIFVGTNNGAGYLDRFPPEVDLGVLLCFEEATGNFLWQHSNHKLKSGRVHDWPHQGVCSTPVVDGNRLWYVSNRGEVICLDTEGFHDDQDDGAQQDIVSLFRLDAFAHGKLQQQVYYPSHLPNSILAEFQNRGTQLPNSIGLSVARDLAAGDDASWTLYENVTDAANRGITGRKPLYRIVLADKFLKVFPIKPDQGQAEPEELFRVPDPLIAGLGTPQVVTGILDELARHGIQTDERSQPQTLIKGGLWSFQGVLGGRLRQFQVRLLGASLFIEMPLQVQDKEDADVIWRFDMMKELGVLQHNMATCSMIAVDGLLYVCTSNGVDESHQNVPAPQAPSFIALDRQTGRVVWTDNSPGNNILHGQWASPSYGVFNGQAQVIFPGGDGWLYSFDPKGDGNGGSKLLWRFDANPKSSLYTLARSATRCHFISFALIYEDLVYIAMGEDPEHGAGQGRLWCIDPMKRVDGVDVSPELAVDLAGNLLPARRVLAVDATLGERGIPNPNSAEVWHYSQQDHNADGKFDSWEETFHRSLSTPVIKDGILYASDGDGFLHCLNAQTGQAFWTYDLFAGCWSSPMLVEDKVYMADEDGKITIFRHDAKPQVSRLLYPKKARQIEVLRLKLKSDGMLINECDCGDAIYTTPIVANNVLYVATRRALYAIEQSIAK